MTRFQACAFGLVVFLAAAQPACTDAGFTGSNGRSTATPAAAARAPSSSDAGNSDPTSASVTADAASPPVDPPAPTPASDESTSTLVSSDPASGTVSAVGTSTGTGTAAAVSFASALVCADNAYHVGAICEPAVPIYRWFRTASLDHFYTSKAGPSCVGRDMHAAECGGEAVNESHYAYEGVAFWALPPDHGDVPGLVRLERLHNVGLAVHLYSTVPAEIQDAIANDGYVDEGAYQIFGTAEPFTKPIYRWINSGNGARLLTFAAGPSCEGKTLMDPECGTESVNENGYHFDKIIGYLFQD